MRRAAALAISLLLLAVGTLAEDATEAAKKRQEARNKRDELLRAKLAVRT